MTFWLNYYITLLYLELWSIKAGRRKTESITPITFEFILFLLTFICMELSPDDCLSNKTGCFLGFSGLILSS